MDMYGHIDMDMYGKRVGSTEGKDYLREEGVSLVLAILDANGISGKSNAHKPQYRATHHRTAHHTTAKHTTIHRNTTRHTATHHTHDNKGDPYTENKPQVTNKDRFGR
eukprot:520324-Amorphochlora_amoeboformis.AAC.1